MYDILIRPGTDKAVIAPMTAPGVIWVEDNLWENCYWGVALVDLGLLPEIKEKMAAAGLTFGDDLIDRAKVPRPLWMKMTVPVGTLRPPLLKKADAVVIRELEKFTEVVPVQKAI